MQFSNEFTVDRSPAEAWLLLLDVPKMATCMPGAQLLEELGNDTYKGRVTVKLGPIRLGFMGKATIVEKNDADHTARIVASGVDSNGRGNASAEARFKLTPDGPRTRINIAVELNLTGAVAQYGRGASIIQDVASQMISEFEARLAAQLRESGEPGTATAPTIPNNGELSLGRIILREIRKTFNMWWRSMRFYRGP